MSTLLFASYHPPIDYSASSSTPERITSNAPVLLIVDSEGKTQDNTFVIPVRDLKRPYRDDLVPTNAPSQGSFFKLAYKTDKGFRFSGDGAYSIQMITLLPTDVVEQELAAFEQEQAAYHARIQAVEQYYAPLLFELQDKLDRMKQTALHASSQIVQPQTLESRLRLILRAQNL